MKITYDPRYLKGLFQLVMDFLSFQAQSDTPETGCVNGEDSFVAIEQHSLERIIWRFLSAGNRTRHAIFESHSSNGSSLQNAEVDALFCSVQGVLILNGAFFIH